MPASKFIKNEQQSIKRQSAIENRDSIDESLSDNLLTQVEQARDKGASSWLNLLPVDEQGLTLSKEDFRESLRMRYNMLCRICQVAAYVRLHSPLIALYSAREEGLWLEGTTVCVIC